MYILQSHKLFGYSISIRNYEIVEGMPILSTTYNLEIY